MLISRKMFSRRSAGSFKETQMFLEKCKDARVIFKGVMEKNGQIALEALQRNVPFRTGLTAASFFYKIQKNGIQFYNRNIVSGLSVAVMLQYGHGTKNGGYVQPYDYINPSLEPVFKNIIEEMAMEVNRL